MNDLEQLWLRTISDDPKMIAYRPRLRSLAGSITATILLQQIVYRWTNNDFQPFYKYKEPCDADDCRPGDSWCEELGFSREEFDSALKRIAQKVSRNVAKDESKFVWYWTMPDRKTWYDVNYVTLCKAAIPLYVKRETPSTQSGNPSLDLLYTKNTSKKTTKRVEELIPDAATLPPSPTVAHPPPSLIDRAIELADKESFDPPSSKPSSLPSSKPKPRPKPATTPRCDGRKFQGGYIPAGTGTTPVEVYYESFSINEAKLSAPNEDDLTSACPDLDRLRSVLTAYRRSNYRKGNVQLILDWYRDGVPAFGGAPAKKGQANATSRQSATQAGDYDWYSQFGNTPTAKT